MKFNSIYGLTQRALSIARIALFASITSVLVACGGGGVTSTAPSPEAVFIKDRRALPSEYLARKAVAYSPFRTSNRDTETITAAMVKQDLDLLIQGNFRLIRLFDSSDKVTKLVLDVIVDNNFDMKVQLGAYVIGSKYQNRSGFFIENNPYIVQANEALNQAELARAISLANDPKYKSTILAVSVGNETLVNWSTVPIDPPVLAGYISKVRSSITQAITTDDNFLAFTNPVPRPVLDQIDFVAIHIYPNIDTQFPDGDLYWDWKQLSFTAGTARANAMMDASIVTLRRQYQMVRVALDSMGLHAMPIAITETGWKAFDAEAPKQAQRAHPVNQKMYYQRLEILRAEGRVAAGPANIFYFEAFDEPWKGGDDGWGLFDVNRKARYVVQDLSSSYVKANPLIVDDTSARFFELPSPGAQVTSSSYTLLANAAGLTEITTLRIDAFDNPATANRLFSSTDPSPDGGQYMVINPAPKSFGWGQLWQPEARTEIELPSYSRNENLELFASGHVNVYIKTTYPGKIELGISSLTANGDSAEAQVQIGEGDFGYKRDGTWNLVRIPLSKFVEKNNKIDLRFVVSPFIISDVYARTGKSASAGYTDPIRIDGIRWSR
jgi:exo-beta-1,3-glucanase (GH17 family)